MFQRKRHLLLLLFFLSLSLNTQAQLETRWWYFGLGAGLDFGSGTAVSDTSNVIKTGGAGAATQSDASGNLLFYYGHDTLVNRLHQPMLNGTGLLEEGQSEQSTVSVPRPNKEGQFYVFTVDAANTYFGVPQENGFFYHLVDMSLDNGLGAVVDTAKNIVLMDDSTSEKISATLHANGIDYWVMIQQSGTNLYHAYLVTENGPSAVPVTPQFGVVANNYGLCEGAIRFNHAGNMMACTKNTTLEVFDFDAATGQLSNPKILPNQLGVGPGLEFSADDTKLYTGVPSQFDVTLPTAADIAASQVILAFGQTYGLQYALDGRIYGISWFGAPTGYMSVINNPNEAGFACGFQDSVVYLQGRSANEALPLFMSHLFKTNFSTDSVCVGSTASFKINFHFIDSVQWNFGDPASGAANTSTLVNPTHVYSAAGNYTVTLIAQNGVKSDTVIKTIWVEEIPQIDLGPDRDLCLTNPDSVKLGLDGQRGVYNWSSGSVDSAEFVTTSSWPLSGAEVALSVQLSFTNQCGSDRDTVLVYGSEPLSVNLGPDTILCADEFLVNPEIDTLTPVVQLLWQDSSTAGTFLQLSESELENSHNIRLTATNACGSASDSMLLTFLSVPDGILPNDSVHCLDEGFYLVSPNRTGISYVWDDQTTDFQRYVSSTGTYGLTSYNQCDTLRDTFNVVFNGEPKSNIPNDTVVCPEQGLVIRNQLRQLGQTYVWSSRWLSGAEATAEATDSIWSLSGAEMTALFDSEPGTSGPLSEAEVPLSVRVRVTLKECSILDSTLVYLRGDCYDGCTPTFANIFTPNADGQNDQFSSELDCETENYHLSIFNRWGALVFESTHQNLTWDGSVNGIPAGNGVYYYVLSYQPTGQEQREYRGYVQLAE
jgi:gliding motility-associated-like protein